MTEAIAGGERRSFASLEELCAFLHTRLRSRAAPPDDAMHQASGT
jgi:hypothetical protein